MCEAPAIPPSHPQVGLLFRVRARGLWNRICQTVSEAPLRLSASIILIAIIWAGIYVMFLLVFNQLRRSPLEATVALPLVFNVFFAAMLVLLAFSNAIIAYGALFRKDESAYLLSSPLMPLDVVTLKCVESLFVASWSLVLLGIPLMLALAKQVEHGVFYLLFIAFFIAFIPIPGALGLLMAWAAARFFPRRMIHIAAAVAAAIMAVLIVLGLRSLRIDEGATEIWLQSFQQRMGIVQSAFLPNNWVAAGIDRAMYGRFGDAGMYLCVTFINGLFLSWIAVMLVSRYFDGAYNRASSGGDASRRLAAQASGGLAGEIFWYLPLPLRLIAAKDLRTFLRDPLQWSQLVILFGLLALYLTNMPTIRQQFEGLGWFALIPFLNLCAISLILAAFTCRFVFPLVSLEGQKLWLIGLLPMRRGKLLHAKFAFAMTVTLLVALGSMLLAVVMLRIDLIWTAIHVTVTVAVCYGLCGFAVGIGARLPMFGELNAGRIANGLGGTTNLLASVALVTVVLIGVGIATWHSLYLPQGEPPAALDIAICAVAAIVSVAAGTIALIVGARHLNRVEV